MTTQVRTREVVGGVDTHGRTHHGAVIDATTGKLLGDQEFPATTAGYRQLLRWLRSHGTVASVGVEGTGSYGAGLTRHLHGEGVAVVEVARPNRQARRLQGKSDPIDAINAARAVLAETATTVPKFRGGTVESIRMIHATRRSAVKTRTAVINQMHALLHAGPEALRTQVRGLKHAALVARCAALRASSHGSFEDPDYVAKMMLRRLARRVVALDAEIAEADTELRELLEQIAPTLLSVYGVGPECAGQLVVTAGENSTRLHSEAALARLTGIAPIPASSGATSRYRLHRGGDRQANRAIHMIVMCRLTCHQPTKTYIARRISEGKTKKDAVRCLKRAVVREIYRALISDLHACGIVPAAPTGANQVPPAAEVKAGRRPPEGHGLDHGEDGTTIAAHGAGMNTHHAT